MTADQLLSFEEGRIEPADFPHREHVRFAYGMLAHYSLGEALVRFRIGLQHIARKAGQPQLYHETITVAFLALIGERRASTHAPNWDEFIAANADLLDKNVLLRWYSKEQLESDLARRTFCLPAPRGK
ncbi:MAG: hypothetical protein ACJ8HQ_04175 [Chthoniobacterales bacterium]